MRARSMTVSILENLNENRRIRMKRTDNLRPVILSVAVFLASSALGGCAIGNKYRFGAVVADARVSGNLSIAVATTDQREYVKSGAKRPQFVGIQRGGYGNPFDVATESGKPLADDVSDAICASLRKRGFNAAPIYVAATQPESKAREALTASGRDRLILVVLNELKTDTYTNVAFMYDVAVVVFDRGGGSLANVQIEDRKDLAGSVMNPPAHARRAVPIAFKNLLEELLNDDGVAAALSGQATKPAPVPVVAGGSGRCEKDVDCPGEKICVDGSCREPAGGQAETAEKSDQCEKDVDCPGELVCIDGGCKEPAPRPAEPADESDDSCSEDEECKGRKICIDGACERPRRRGGDCARNEECRSRLVCIEGSCERLRGKKGKCETDAHCRGKFVCIDGACDKPKKIVKEPLSTDGECKKDTDCDGDRICVKAKCISP